MAARAIQFFTPGIPQVYYVGLLAGENDAENVLKTGEEREINRHNYSLDEIDEAVQKPVVQRLMKLIRFRNQYPAFNGTFHVAETKSDRILMSWKKDDSRCVLHINLKTYQIFIAYIDEDGRMADYQV